MKIYLTDGTEGCFYTAAFSACTDRSCIVTSARSLQLPLGAETVCVTEDEQKRERVKRKLRELDPPCLRELGLILRRGCDAREMTALAYLRRIVAERGPVRSRLSDPDVLEAMTEMRKVTGEAHNFTGFLRFMEGANGVYYGPFAPDNDILELILPHFLKRFSSQAFVIHDTARRKAALYNGKECILTQTEEKVSIALSDYENSFQDLWKEYYRSVNIVQRPHERQMKASMPVRYWKYMPEKQ